MKNENIDDLPYIEDLREAKNDGLYSWMGVPIEIKGDEVRLAIPPENIHIDPSVADFESEHKHEVKKLLHRLESEGPSEDVIVDLYYNTGEMARSYYMMEASCNMLGYELKDKEWRELLRRSISVLESMRIDTSDISQIPIILKKMLNQK